jgi:hypothetical protein
MIAAHSITLEKHDRKDSSGDKDVGARRALGVRNGFQQPWSGVSGFCKYNYRGFYAVSGAKVA